MSVSDGQTYERFRAAITSLIARSVEPQPAIMIRANRYLPVGIGCYVGQNTQLLAGEPQTDQLHGRRLQGTLIVVARDPNDAGIGAEVDRLTQVLVGAGRSALFAFGIQRLALREISPLRGSGDEMRERDFKFDVLFEAVTVPDTAPDTIREIDVSLETDGVVESFVLEEQP